jgi:hypothetical protein
MTGAAKEQCVRDENAKTEGSTPSGSGSSSSASGAGAPVSGTSIGTGSVPSGAGAAPQSSAGSSSKCEALSGGEKADCLRKEGFSTGGTGSTDRPGAGSTGMGR